MPIRIKPIHKLEPCVLDFNSIKNICKLVEKHFPKVIFSAQEDFWEIYNERSLEIILEAISKRERLDLFGVEGAEYESGTKTFQFEDNETQAESDATKNQNSISIIRGSGVIHGPDILIRSVKVEFTQYQATIHCEMPPDHLEWFEDFVFDLDKYLKPATLAQRMWILSNELPSPYKVSIPRSRYCQIVIKRKVPDPFLEGIKVNLVSNLIWAILGVMIGFIAALSTGIVDQFLTFVRSLFK